MKLNTPKEKLKELGYNLDEIVVPAPKAKYVPIVRTGNMLYTAGHVPYKLGTTTLYAGKVGRQFSVEEAHKISELVVVNLLKRSLDKVEKIVKLNGFVNADDSFHQHSAVINGASELLIEVFGTEIGSHARTAIGAPSLPFDGQETKYAMLRNSDSSSGSLFSSSDGDVKSLGGNSCLLHDILDDLRLEQSRKAQPILPLLRRRKQKPNKEDSPKLLPNGRDTHEEGQNYEPVNRKDAPEIERNWEALFNKEDTIENVAFDTNGKLIAATVAKLVERLTLIVSTEFMNDFLLSFRSFLTPADLSEMLAFRLIQGYMNKEEAIKLRTFVVLRQWICNYYEIDFGDEHVKMIILESIDKIKMSKLELTLADNQILEKLKKYVNKEELAPEELPTSYSRESNGTARGTVNGSQSSGDSGRGRSWMATLGKRVGRLLRGGRKDDEIDGQSLTSPSIESTPSSLYPLIKGEDLTLKYEKHSCFAMEYTGIMAEHLCLIESKLFHSISWTELISYPHQKENLHLDSCIEHFNQMCQWMISEIIMAPSHQEQAVIIQKLIRVALKCLGYSNFNSVMQILLALQNPAVEGLYPAWKRLSDYERSLFGDLVTFVSPLKNFRNIRKAMELQELTGSPCVPFTGLYLSDLSSNKERPYNLATDLIPWFKYQTSARIIRQFKGFQSVDRLYSFTLRPELYKYLISCCQQIQEEQ